MGGKIKIAKLTTIAGVARELAEVYRLARIGTLEPGDAGKLAGILTAVKGCLESSAVETRLTGIETALGIKPAVLKLVRPS